MGLTIVYDQDADVLRVMTHEADREVTCAHLEDDLGVLVGLDDDAGTHVVSVDVMGASAYLPLGTLGYDSASDTLTLGAGVSDATIVTDTGDIVTYWRSVPGDSVLTPIGVAIRRASEHLVGVNP